MAVPDYQTLLLPLLRLAAKGHAHTLAQAEELIAESFALSAEDRTLLLPSGQQTALRNRIGWASFYLKHAGLLEKPKRGQFFITVEGLQMLEKNPSSLSVKDLVEVPAFAAFYSKSATNSSPATVETGTTQNQTPDEVLQSAYLRINQELAEEVLVKLLAASPEFFERAVVELLVAMGYGGTLQDAGQRIGKSGDGGIDGIIKEDRLGLDAIYIQAKRWQGTVGRPEIQKFVGALQGQRARKGVFMTTSGFTSEATQYAAMIDTKVVLLSGAQIAQLMIDYDVGVSKLATYEVKRLDSDYFEEV